MCELRIGRKKLQLVGKDWQAWDTMESKALYMYRSYWNMFYYLKTYVQDVYIRTGCVMDLIDIREEGGPNCCFVSICILATTFVPYLYTFPMQMLCLSRRTVVPLCTKKKCN